MAGRALWLRNSSPLLKSNEVFGGARRMFALAPWPSHDPRGCCHAQKLIEDRPVVYQASGRGRRYEIASPHRRRRPAHWCRRRALATLHGVVQGIAVGNIDECSAAAELWKGGDSPPLSLRGEQ